MNIIICGNLLPLDIEKQIEGASLAAGKYLRNLSDALEKKGYSTNSVMYVALPRASEAIRNYKDDGKHFFVLKDRLVVPSVFRYHREILKHLNSNDIALFYNINYSQWGLVKKLEKHNVKCVLLLADHTPAKDYRSSLRKIAAVFDEREFFKFHCAVLFSHNARKYLCNDCNYKVIEGGIDFSRFRNLSPPPSGKKRFLYAGTFEMVTGVDRLLQAIGACDVDSEFVFCGKGSLANSIKNASMSDCRIIYRGYVSEDEYMDILNNSNVVINPRNMEMSENSYNFPSKILEYLASGRTVISTRFPGWEKFKDNFIFVGNRESEMTEAINNVAGWNDGQIGDTFNKNRELALFYDWNNRVDEFIELITG